MTHVHGNRRGTLARVLLLVGAIGFAAVATAAGQRMFGSADEAASALVQAVKAHDRAAILAILGPSSEKWITSGDAVADRAAGEKFVAQFEQKHAIEAEGDSKATLNVGPDDWPFAFPLVKSTGGWRFDTEAGKDEIVARRVGENELAAINVMLAIVDAQRDYASEDHNKDGVREYALKFASSPGKRDGLFWPTKEGEKPSPLGPLVTRAAGEGYGKGTGENAGQRPYHGYYFRLLSGQTKNAKGGAQDYVVKGHVIGGFAAIAYPGQYAKSGVMSFIVNHDGVVYQKDLGPDTAKIAKGIKRFDPAGWTAASPQ